MANVQDLRNEILKSLQYYRQGLGEDIEKESKRLTMQAIKRLKATSPKRTGWYSRGWKYKKRGKIFVLYNTEYRLTHLLEKRHLKRNHKGFTDPQPHIKPVETAIKKDLQDFIEQKVQNV